MKFIPITGLVRVERPLFDGMRAERLVNGFAFEFPVWDWFHCWVTPWQGGTLDMWTVSHWESGLRVGGFSDTKEGAAQAAIERAQKQGEKMVRDCIASSVA